MIERRARFLSVVGIGVMAAACGRPSSPARLPEAPAPLPAQSSHTEPIAAMFRHVNLHVDDGVVLEIRRLDGALVGTQPDAFPTFDDPRSFTVRIDSGEVAMSPRTLANVMNRHVFAYQGAPLRNLELSIESGHLTQKGTLHKKIDVPFSMVSAVSVTADGRIRLHPLSVKVLGIPSSGLMTLLGMDLGSLITLKAASGITTQGTDVLLAPDRLLPAPTISGRLTGIRIEAERLVELFGPPQPTTPLVPPDPIAPNFLYFRGGTLRFGRLTMSDADLEIVGDASERAFEFSLPHYARQLVAGYSKTTPSGGLIAHMPSYRAQVAPTATLAVASAAR